MTELIRFMDDDRKGRWANIRMDNGDPCWVGIAQTGILVKKSKIGLFGAKLYEEKNIYKAAKTAQALSIMYPNDLTPDKIWNPVLKSIVNAVLHCSSLAEVTRVLNEAYTEDLDKVSRFTNGEQYPENSPKNISLMDIKEKLKEAVFLLGTNQGKELAGLLVSMYMAKLQEEFGPLVPAYPEALLPAPKDVLKKIGFFYAKSFVDVQHNLMRYQEEGSISYTNFQPITEEQWNEIKSGRNENLIRYMIDIRGKGRSEVSIPLWYKELIDKKIKEHDEAVKELHNYLWGRKGDAYIC